MKRKKKILLIISIILLLILGNVLYTSSSFYKVNQYKKYYEEKKCDKIYDLIKKYGDFDDRESYIKTCNIEINNTKLPEKIKYERDGIKVYIEDSIVPVLKNIIIYVPENLKEVKLNGKELKDYKQESQVLAYDKYVIDYLYDTKYILTGLYDNEILTEIFPILIKENYAEFHNNPLNLTVFTTPSCIYCTNTINFLDNVKQDMKTIFTYTTYDVTNSKNLKLFNEYKENYNIKIEGFPTIIVGNDYIQGYQEDKTNDCILTIYKEYRTSK